MTRLRKGWYRLGIVLTVAWLLCVSGLAAYESRAWARVTPLFSDSIFFDVTYDNAHRGDTEDPMIVNSRFRRDKFLYTALLPLAALWTIILVAMPAARWVYYGFKT